MLAVACAAIVFTAFAGVGAASGGEDRTRLSGENEEASLDQYARDDRPSGEPEAVGGDVVRKTGEPRAPRSSPSGTSGADASSANASASGNAARDAASRAPVSYNARAIFPLPEQYFDSYTDDWGAARPQGGHEGTDLMSPRGTPLYAITDGTVVPVSGSNANGWNSLGGYTVMIRADHGIGPVKKGDLFYYAHMDRESELPIGARVEAGERVGVVGDTGYGPEVTRGKFPTHLHLGWYDTTGTTSEAPSGAMNPYPLLEWLKRSGGTASGGTASGGWGSREAAERYCDYQDRAARDAASGGARDDHGPREPSADLDTGSSDPRPSPVADRRSSGSETGRDSRQSPQRAQQNEGRSRQTQSPTTRPESVDEGSAQTARQDEERARDEERDDAKSDAKRSGQPDRTKAPGPEDPDGSGPPEPVAGEDRPPSSGADQYRDEDDESSRATASEDSARITIAACGGSSCEGAEGTVQRWEVRLLDGSGRLVEEGVVGLDEKHRFSGLRPGNYEVVFSAKKTDSSGAPQDRKLSVSAGDHRSVEIR